jgi:hypothetical protein
MTGIYLLQWMCYIFVDDFRNLLLIILLLDPYRVLFTCANFTLSERFTMDVVV